MRSALMLGLILGLAGCEPEPPTAPAAGVGEEAAPVSRMRLRPSPVPGFEGVRDAVAGEDWIHVRWEPVEVQGGAARGKVRVRLFPREGGADAEGEAHDAVPGATALRIRGLSRGAEYGIAAHWVEADGTEVPNPRRVRAALRPVRYVDPEAEPSAKHFPSISAALGSAVGEVGVNVFLRGGEYRERVILFGGTTLYGGFAAGFEVDERDSIAHRSILLGRGAGEIVRIAPGDRWAGLCGVELDGAGEVGRGIVGDDCRLFLLDVELRRFRRRGLHLRSLEDQHSYCRLVMDHCAIAGCEGEGMSIEGAARVQMESCTLRDNGLEGIELDTLRPAPGRVVGLSMRDCDVVGNADAGLDLEVSCRDLSGVSGEVVPEILLEGCRFLHNGGTGFRLDLSGTEAPQRPIELWSHGNVYAGSGAGGVQLDLDAPGRYRLEGDLLEGNAGPAGLRVTGDSPRARLELRDVLFVSHPECSVLLECAAAVELSSCAFWDGPAVIRGSSGSLRQVEGLVDPATAESDDGLRPGSADAMPRWRTEAGRFEDPFGAAALAERRRLLGVGGATDRSP